VGNKLIVLTSPTLRLLRSPRLAEACAVSQAAPELSFQLLSPIRNNTNTTDFDKTITNIIRFIYLTCFEFHVPPRVAAFISSNASITNLGAARHNLVNKVIWEQIGN
jgi:hypothetical protein